jgi:hypothetical protein
MKKMLAMSVAFMAFAGAVYDAAGQDRQMRGGPGGPGAGGGGGGPAQMLQRADDNRDGTVSFEEFAAVMGNGVGDSDLNGDGRITTEEIVRNIVETRIRPMADQMVQRFDQNGDGVLTKREVDTQQKQMFARMDRDGNGKIEGAEMQPRGGGGQGRPAR